MGQAKLLLPFGDGTVLDHVLAAWTRSQVDEVVVVVRADDHPLQIACQRWPVQVVCPETDPPDMKASLCAGLAWLHEERTPANQDGCFVGPCDVPEIQTETIQRLVDAWKSGPPEISRCDSGNTEGTEVGQCRVLPRPLVVPSFGGRGGHPVLFPWSEVPRIFQLADDQGVNRLLERMPKEMVEMPVGERPKDIDTPEEYLAAVERAAKRREETQKGKKP